MRETDERQDSFRPFTVNSVQQCFSHFFQLRASLIEISCTSHCRAQAQTLPIAQDTPVLIDSFSRVYDPHTHACKARPPSTDGWTSLSVIVIVMTASPTSGAEDHLCVHTCKVFPPALAVAPLADKIRRKHVASWTAAGELLVHQTIALEWLCTATHEPRTLRRNFVVSCEPFAEASHGKRLMPTLGV